ncbi:ricin-type beta-trefoil lectin domain protein [Streptomyces graminilatus]|uniref:ricin-type beta-trefoil lectin domain protein n=1 Tax=Streptomyces graminilatus TaxID=1464070 RepID=UPI0006E2B47A|nr:RICIN domain-containing protein [Streptomyces graminilatus]
MPRPRLFTRARTKSGLLAPLLASAVGVALLGGLAVRPELLGRYAGHDMAAVADSYDGFDAAAAEQLRQDQCLMTEALRMGGPAMFGVAKDALGQTPDKLRTAANREYWNTTPLSTATDQDKSAADKEGSALYDHIRDFQISGLPTPGGFKSVTDFEWPPGVGGDDRPNFFQQTGLPKWIWEQFWKSEGDFYRDLTPPADQDTVKAVKDLGDPLYGKSPDPSLPGPQWQQAYAEHQAYDNLVNWSMEPTAADNARLFLSYGGFPRTAPEPGSVEYRIAVEDLKTRFASCAWRTPVDPDKVLGKEVATASAEWQQEIAAQATQRTQILTASQNATKALAAGSKALGEMLGLSWRADHLTRWQDYWSAGGPGWIGDSPFVVHAHGATDKCLEVAGAKKDNGTPVQIFTCNGGAGQKWQISGDTLVNTNSGKCLTVKSGSNTNGAAVQISTCGSSASQKWEYGTHGTTRLYNPGSGNCLDLADYTNSRDGRMWDCTGKDPQKFDIVPSGHNGTDDLDYPTKAQFDKAKKGVTDAQTAAKTQLDLLKDRAAVAKTAATASDTALKAAYDIADRAGAPRGRALLVGQQKAQVTKASAAALDALAKAGDTAYAATRAAAGDSETIAARALTQAAQSKAAFRTAAAAEARAQAKAAADAAAVQAQTAKTARDLAKAKLAETQKAEADAKAAAADAHAKLLAAQAEEATAKAEKETAAAKQAEAAQHRQNAQGYAQTATEAKGRAETAESNARGKRQDAEAARDRAKGLSDDAWDAESKSNAARAKANAKDAYAEAHESDSDAKDSRAAANEADQAADDAESAATSARAEADAAGRAAADADAAATRAEAAATRARSDADAAQAAKLRADAAVRTATSAAADAIKASQAAAAAARTAVQLADEAEKHAADAMKQADAAKAEAAKAVAGAADAAGHAYTTAQAAEEAGNAAQQVAAPANDAIQLGSPYVTTDSAAGLAVLSGQSSKTIAEQQQAVAAAHAANAQKNAAQAQSLADAATGDAKAAYTLAAEAAGFAANARRSAQEALGYAAEAAKYAADAQASLARAVEYDRQAGVDAAAADKAAGRAEGYATDARASADQAALDADAARTAAAEAEQAAKDARAAADRADAEATAAEQAAKDAQKYADSAQQAADQAAQNDANKQVQTGAGTGTGVGGVFSVIDDIKQRGDPQRLPDDCSRLPCDLVFEVHFDAVVSYYYCDNPAVPATESGCPAEDTFFLKTLPFKDLTKKVKISSWEATKELWKGLYNSIIKDFTGCYHKITKANDGGSYGDCAWAATWLPLGGPIAKITDAIRAVDAAMRTGIGVSDALKALRALDVDARTLNEIERSAKAYEELRTACPINSFPGGTEVLLADGGRKAIRDVRNGDLLLATDPASGRTVGEPVTFTFSHPTQDLLDITLAGGGSLTSTPGHRMYVLGSGWTLASDLRAGDSLRAPDGSSRTVTEVTDRNLTAPRTVYDLTVSGLHTFYAVAGDAPVLVHNCKNLVADAQEFDGLAHVLDEHTFGTGRGFVNSEQRAKDLATLKGGPNGVFTDLATAQAVVDHALTTKAAEIQRWLRGSAREKPLTGTFGAGSLGKVAKVNGSVDVAGNGYKIVLKRASGHKNGFYVFTAFPV